MNKFIAVGFNQTLVIYDNGIKENILENINKVKELMKDHKVKIFTSLVNPRIKDSDKNRIMIEKWSQDTFGEILPITCLKDPDIIEFFDNKVKRM